MTAEQDEALAAIETIQEALTETLPTGGDIASGRYREARDAVARAMRHWAVAHRILTRLAK